MGKRNGERMFRGLQLLLVGCIAAGAGAHAAVAQDLEPKVYKSRSGDYVLTVDPEERKGAGQ